VCDSKNDGKEVLGEKILRFHNNVENETMTEGLI